MWKELALGFALAVSTGALAADNPPPQPSAATTPPALAPNDPRVAAAVDLLQTQNMKANMRFMMDSLVNTAASAIRAEHPDVTDQNLKLFNDAFSQEIEASLDGLLKLQAQIYAQHFSESELRALAQFYKSDLGRKVVQQTPLIMKEEVPVALKWGQATAPAAMQRALDKLKKEGVKL